MQQAPSERFNRVSSFSYNGTNPFGATGNFMFPGNYGIGKSLYKMPLDNWGPRVGLAWRVTDDWVVRSGFGVTYTPSNTGYFGGPYYFGAQNFVEKTTSALTPLVLGALLTLGSTAEDPLGIRLAGPAAA